MRQLCLAVARPIRASVVPSIQVKGSFVSDSTTRIPNPFVYKDLLLLRKLSLVTTNVHAKWYASWPRTLMHLGAEVQVLIKQSRHRIEYEPSLHIVRGQA